MSGVVSVDRCIFEVPDDHRVGDSNLVGLTASYNLLLVHSCSGSGSVNLLAPWQTYLDYYAVLTLGELDSTKESIFEQAP